MVKEILIGTALVGGAAIGLAGSRANADPSTEQETQDFLAAVQADGISGSSPAILEDANEFCWDLANYGPHLTVANFRQEIPEMVAEFRQEIPEASQEESVTFVTDASENYCQVASYEYWSYGTDASGGGGGGGG
jgi:hypothetical protein